MASARVLENKNEIQILSDIYEEDNVIKKKYIGNLEDCVLASYDVLENKNNVSNNTVLDTNVTNNYEVVFALE